MRPDDAVDSTTQALNYLRELGEGGFMRWLIKSKEAQRAQEKNVKSSTWSWWIRMKTAEAA